MRTAAMSCVIAWGVLAPLLAEAAPPVQRPSQSPTQAPAETEAPAGDAAPTDAVEAAPVEAAPVEAAPVEPTAVEPTAVEAAPAEPEAGALPSYDAELPSFDEAPIDAYGDPGFAVEPPPEPEPEVEIPLSGRGRVAVGSILLAGGAVLTGLSIGMYTADIDAVAWIGGAVVGSGALVAGPLLILTGKIREKRYRQWAAIYGGEPTVPRSGAGFSAAGLTCIIAGGAGLTIGGLSLTVQDEDDLPYGQVMMSLAGASFATGVGLMIVGGKRKREFQRWRNNTISPSFSLLPSTAPQRIGGAAFGFSGRF